MSNVINFGVDSKSQMIYFISLYYKYPELYINLLELLLTLKDKYVSTVSKRIKALRLKL
jgi:hypothetical protein